jgi:hypothetical protein
MTIDISKIKPGDKVTLVPLEVERTVNTGGTVRVILDKNFSHYFDPHQIAAHHPAPREIGVGDRVRVNRSVRVATVRAVDNDQAWVRWNDCDGEGNYTYWVSDLTLVEGDQ